MADGTNDTPSILGLSAERAAPSVVPAGGAAYPNSTSHNLHYLNSSLVDFGSFKTGVDANPDTGTVTGVNGTAVSGTNGNVTKFGASNTLGDAGFLATNVVRKDAANTGAAAMTLNMAASTTTDGFRVPVIAGTTSTASGSIVFDSTNKNYHGFQNLADSIFAAFAVTGLPANNDCLKAVVNASNYLIGDAGGGCVIGTAYQTIDSNGSAVTQRSIVNYISGSNATVSCVDNSGSGRTDCTISASSSAGSRLDQITAATGANSINNGDFTQTWNWSKTSAATNAFRISENVASTSTGTSNLLQLDTLASSTLSPLQVTARGTANGVRVDPATGTLGPIGTANINATQLNGTAFSGTNGDVVSFGAANIPADSGVVAANLATASGTLTNHGVALGAGTKTLSVTAVGATDKPLVGVTSADPAYSKLTLTNPATAATITIADNKTVTVSNTLTLAGTDSTTMTFPTTSATIARTDAANTFTGHQTIEGVTSTGATGTGNLVYSASPTFTGTALGAAATFTGVVTALADFNTGTSKTFSLGSGYFECTGTCTITMPVPAAGQQFCVRNANNVATVITFAAIGSSARYENTASTAYGTAGTGTLVSGGAVGDKVCLVGKDSTHYDIFSFNGTWTAN